METKSSKSLQSEEFSFEKIEDFIKTALVKAKPAEKKEIVLVLGNTGAGKSTGINYMLGCEMQRTRSSYGTYVAVPVDTGREFAKIGQTLASETRYSQVYENGDVAYCDCPGFIDNRSKDERICASMSVELAVKLAEKVKGIMLVIDFKALTVDRAASLNNLMRLLSQLLVTPSAVEASILFVFTKIPRSHGTKDAILFTIEEIITSDKERLEEIKKAGKGHMNGSQHKEYISLTRKLAVLQLIKNNPDNIMLLNVFDKGESKQQMFNKLTSLIPLSKEVFNFHNYDENRVSFNKAVYQIVQRGILLTRDKIQLPKKIRQCDERLKEYAEKLPFYEDQICAFESDISLGDEQKKVVIATLLERKDKNARPLMELNRNIQRLQQKIANDQRALSQLDTDEPVQYWEEQVNDERNLFGRIFNFRTLRNFSYDDIPFLNVELTKDNGSFTVIASESENGKYQVNYESEEGKDGRANVKVFIKKRNKPDNKQQIDNLKDNLKTSRNNLTTLLNARDLLNAENEALTQSITLHTVNSENRKLQAQNLESTRRAILADIEKQKKDIEALMANLALVESEFKESHALFETVAQIAFIIGFDSELVNYFLKLYYKLPTENVLEKSELPIIEKTHQEMKNFKCPITLSTMMDPVITPCGHSFERFAIIQHCASRAHPTCPTCRNPIDTKELTPNRNLRNAIEQTIKGKFLFFPHFKVEASASLEALELQESALKDQAAQLRKETQKIDRELLIIANEIKRRRYEQTPTTEKVKWLFSQVFSTIDGTPHRGGQQIKEYLSARDRQAMSCVNHTGYIFFKKQQKPHQTVGGVITSSATGLFEQLKRKLL